jgi:cytochrome c-type biogenesis protein CcmF
MPQLGDYFISAAAFCSLGSALLYFVAWRTQRKVLGTARLYYRFAAGFIIAALATLLYLMITHDFSVKYVYAYSSTDLPLYYLISAVWGGQEGTLLLWIAFASIIGLFMTATAREFERGNMVWLSLFLLSVLVILIRQSPFELAPVVRTEGAGLNPLLIDFWMTIHPPIMFLGFAAAIVPFCYALTALVERWYFTWAEAAQRWTLFAWTMLGIAIVMGGYWAYETLGWGGYWAWDPVENASLIPWIFLTAQLHTLYIKRQRQGFMRFSLVMACLTFWSVLYGTFLTRSGVLADFSVHSFVDLGINKFLIAGLIVFVGLGSFLLVLRWREIKSESSVSKANSRTYLTALGIVVLFIGAWLVLLGTSAPLLTKVTGNPAAVGLTYYFTTMTPIAVLVLLLIAVAPVFRWNEGLRMPKLLLASGLAFVITVLVLVTTGITLQPLYLLLFGFGAAALVTNGHVFITGLGERRLRVGHLAHIGLALMLIGAAASSAFETKATVTLQQGVAATALGYDLIFTGVVDTPTGYACHVDVIRGGESFTAVLNNEVSRRSENVMRKPHVESYLLSDLYLSPVALDEPGSDSASKLHLVKGQADSRGGYLIRFVNFEMGGHGGGGGDMSATAVVEITGSNGQTETVRPMLRVEKAGVVPVPAEFDDHRGRVEIAGVYPEEGGVELKLAGNFLPPAPSPSLVVEVSGKPLIQVFWFGTLIVFAGGILAIVKTGRRADAADDIALNPGGKSVS